MNTVRSFDELYGINPNYKRRSIDYEEYFAIMDLSKREKEKRIRLAQKLEYVFVFAMYLLGMYGDDSFIAEKIADKFKETLAEDIVLDEFLNAYIENLSKQFVETTRNNPNNIYYLSKDRAMFSAENESNSVMNYYDYVYAKEKGKTRKRWLTEGDNRVRETHTEVRYTTIPINDYFVVGESLMLFPKDTSMDADAEEIVNCRCVVEYI